MTNKIRITFRLQRTYFSMMDWAKTEFLTNMTMYRRSWKRIEAQHLLIKKINLITKFYQVHKVLNFWKKEIEMKQILMNMKRVLFLIIWEIRGLKIRVKIFSIKEYKRTIIIKIKGKKELIIKIIFNQLKTIKFSI